MLQAGCRFILGDREREKREGEEERERAGREREQYLTGQLVQSVCKEYELQTHIVLSARVSRSDTK